MSIDVGFLFLFPHFVYLHDDCGKFPHMFPQYYTHNKALVL